ncbi:metallophosphoesterase family protein [Gillisia sp. Hel_I_29]|uniref:metallophosphoesterase family protein n=1 Tax=Gillisia sp. Hel_I_29 TaxID=1249975 RepID=UPI0005532A9F|nr:metallophosphoesterase family protein [Gillisia sp. Hel_I_29]
MDSEIENIGTLNGKLLLFGGVYSNLQALEKLISIAKSEGIPSDNCICTGDIIGYCAQPQQTIQLFKDWGARAIAGNVEVQLAEDKDDCGCDFREGSRCDNFSQLWYPFAKAHLEKDSIEFVRAIPRNLSFTYADKKVTVVHGSYSNISEFIFKSTPKQVKSNVFEETNSDIIIAGHCGLPFNEKIGDKLWINPGVIGMPANDGTPRVWYAILDENASPMLSHHSFNYEHELANELMLKNGLPQEYANTILTGIWDNTEILPKAESELQGIEIEFQKTLTSQF